MRTIIGICFTAIFVVAMFVDVSAQNNQPIEKKSQNSSLRGPNYTDKNNDGICDNKTDGTCMHQGKKFVDKNKDGICDKKDMKKGKHHHPKKGKGHHGHRPK